VLGQPGVDDRPHLFVGQLPRRVAR
jgi:hypothetical protein